MTHIQHTIAAMAGHVEVNAATQSFSKLQAITTGLHNSMDNICRFTIFLAQAVCARSLEDNSLARGPQLLPTLRR